MRGVGLVGPMTNYVAPPQLIGDVPDRDLDEMRAFAERRREAHRGQWFTVPKLSGFCLLMKRDAYEVIGGFDERFGLGLFERVSRKAAKAAKKAPSNRTARPAWAGPAVDQAAIGSQDTPCPSSTHSFSWRSPFASLRESSQGIVDDDREGRAGEPPTLLSPAQFLP